MANLPNPVYIIEFNISIHSFKLINDVDKPWTSPSMQACSQVGGS